MAKGYSARRGFSNGSGQMLKQQQMQQQIMKMQEDMQKAQQEVEEKTFSASVGGGVVSAEVSGKKEVTNITIKPEAVDPEDVEMLQDLDHLRCERGPAPGRRGDGRQDERAHERSRPRRLRLLIVPVQVKKESLFLRETPFLSSFLRLLRQALKNASISARDALTLPCTKFGLPPPRPESAALSVLVSARRSPSVWPMAYL